MTPQTMIPPLLLLFTAACTSQSDLDARVDAYMKTKGQAQVEATVRQVLTEAAQGKAMASPQSREAAKVEIPVGKSPVLGRLEAKHTLIVFIDYTDAFSSLLMRAALEMLEAKTDDLKVVIKFAPSPQRGLSPMAAKAALAAQALGHFPDYQKRLVDQHTLITQSHLVDWAKDIGISGPEFIKKGTCALLVTGIVECWDLAYLDSSSGQTNPPAAVPAISNATAIYENQIGLCAKLRNEEIRCWGLSENVLNTTDSSIASLPILTSDYGHGCAASPDGEVKCWGSNQFGQLGDSVLNTTAAVPFLNSKNVLQLSVGNPMSCAIVNAGQVQCWGTVFHASLGDGSTRSSSRPVVVAGIETAISVSTAYESACAVLKNGEVRCWGLNMGGGLEDDDRNEDYPLPHTVRGITNAVAVSLQDLSSCALLSTGEVVCWGLESGADRGEIVPHHYGLFNTGIENAVAIQAAGITTCAVISNGSIKCFGFNNSGQLGDGTNTDSWDPVDVVGISDALTLSGSSDGHFCVSLRSGQVKCWGNNESGQLGNGTQVASSIPVTVSGLANAVGISAGRHHSCAVLSSGSVSCWGRNEVGQLGDGTTSDRLVPVAMIGIAQAKSIQAYDIATYVVLRSGNLLIAGSNSSAYRFEPVVINGVRAAVSSVSLLPLAQRGPISAQMAAHVFDAQWYLTNNPDLNAEFGPGNFAAAANHWLSGGMAEGRQASPEFSSKTYLNRYVDLQSSFGNSNWVEAINHYVQIGKSEGRSGN